MKIESKDIIEVRKRVRRTYRVHRRIRDLREDMDMKQNDVALVLNCSQRVYSDYERGIVDIPTEVLITLRNFYGTSIDYLLELTDVKTPLPNSKRIEQVVASGKHKDKK